MESNSVKKSTYFAYLNPREMVKEIHRYGYHFSLAGFWKFYGLSFLGLVLVCFFYRLRLPYILAVLVFSFFLSPWVICNTYRNLYEQKRFLDVSNYLEQMLYSFRKIPKIVTSLEDTLNVFPEGEMHDRMLLVMDRIQNKPLREGDDLYLRAFEPLEQFYKCRRMKQVHDFLVKVEHLGGDFTRALDVLLEDRRLWVERMYEMEKERKSLKVKIVISLILSFLICSLTMFMLPKDFHTTESVICQMGGCILIVSNLYIWVSGQKRLSGSWLNDLEMETQELERIYQNARSFNWKKERLKSFGTAILCAGICFGGIFMKNVWLSVLGAISILFSFMQPGLKHKLARKRILREIDKAFPVWIMELSLFLQTDNSQVALSKSVEGAPYILKKDLGKLSEEIEQNPTGIEPYLNFMKGLDLPDIQSVLRMLYSMSQSGTEETKNQILFLIERNNRLMDKSERMRNEDRLSGTGMLILVPMVTGSLKMMADLGVFLVSLLNLTKNI